MAALRKNSPAVELEIDDRVVRISNPDRVYFPARGETKLDLAHYYLSVGDGIVRARYRHSLREPQNLVQGAIEEYDIHLGGTSNVFLAGHRLRLEISSSNFPRFERNPNTGHAVASEDEMVIATQTIYHDAQRPSHVVLPIIPPETSQG